MAETKKKKTKKKKTAKKKTVRKPRKKVVQSDLKPKREPIPEGYFTTAEMCQKLDISPTAFNYAVRRGRIKAFIKLTGHNGRLFEYEVAKKEWLENVDQAQRDRNNKHKKNQGYEDYMKQRKEDIEKFSQIDFDKIPSSEAERREKVYKAKLAETKYQEQAGKLVDIDVVKSTWFESARKVRDSMNQIPGMLGPELASMTDPNKIERRLKTEINKALERLSEANGAS